MEESIYQIAQDELSQARLARTLIEENLASWGIIRYPDGREYIPAYRGRKVASLTRYRFSGTVVWLAEIADVPRDYARLPFLVGDNKATLMGTAHYTAERLNEGGEA